jgi:hypothetical protein
VEGLLPTLTGILVGLGAASALTGLPGSVLHGVRPTDPPTFLSVALARME